MLEGKEVQGSFLEGAGSYEVDLAQDGILSANIGFKVDIGQKAREHADKASGVAKTVLDLVAKFFGK